MGWVTLSLRKRELKQEHQFYQLRDLQISREKRALARRKAYEMAVLQAEKVKDENVAKQANDYSSIMSDITDLRNSIGSKKDFDTAGSKDYGGQTYTTYDDYRTAINNAITGKQNEYQEMIVQRTEAINNVKTNYDQQVADLEQEVGDQETELEMEQVDVETQMEAISAELKAVSDAISNEIQSSTIKLA